MALLKYPLTLYMTRFTIVLLFISIAWNSSNAQTDIDGIMMQKKEFCIGPSINSSQWTNYWEGNFKRNNLNLGKVTTKSYAIMGNYGISDKLNLLFSLPYVKTSASAGTLHGMSGVQDLTLYLKWMPIEKQVGKGTISVYTIGGASVPLTNYVADYLPLSIGLHSKTASARLMLDYQIGHAFITGSATYTWRDNISLDRTAYYTTQQINSNEVSMPNANSYNIRTGYRSDKLIAEAIFNRSTTLGGFDISKNNMPFPSNRMNASTVGVNAKYVITRNHKFSIAGGGYTTVAGRNVGQATDFYGSIYYVFSLDRKSTSPKKSGKLN